MVTYIFSFFFNLVEKNLLTVKKISKCCENGITCLRKGKFVGSKASLCIQQRLIMYLTRPGIRMSHTEVLHGRSNRLFFLLEKNFLSCAKYFHYFYHSTWLPCKTSIHYLHNTIMHLFNCLQLRISPGTWACPKSNLKQCLCKFLGGKRGVLWDLCK